MADGGQPGHAVIIEGEGAGALVNARVQRRDERDVATLVADLADAAEHQRADRTRFVTARRQCRHEATDEFLWGVGGEAAIGPRLAPRRAHRVVDPSLHDLSPCGPDAECAASGAAGEWHRMRDIKPRRTLTSDAPALRNGLAVGLAGTTITPTPIMPHLRRLPPYAADPAYSADLWNYVTAGSGANGQ